ncbi:MAG: TIGR01459 family HAD-type hydrolase [Pseudomonadota bacterium]
MSDSPYIDSLEAIAGDYDALACDAWGVIHNGRKLLAGAADALRRFQETRGPVVIVTNAPKPSAIIPAQLDRLGLPRAAWSGIVTSGDATRLEMEKHYPAPAWRIGPGFDDALFEGAKVRFASPEDAEFIVCTGLDDGFNEAPEDYRERLAGAAERRLPMVCANPDVSVNWGGKHMWCAGALAQLYESLGGETIYGGKPFAPIYEAVTQEIERAAGAPVAANRILAIGDGLDTDILGANRQGFDALLVAGEGGLLDGASGRDEIASALKTRGLSVRAVMEGLRW